MSHKTAFKEHKDNRFAGNTDFGIFFKDPNFDENTQGVFESPALRQRRLKHEDAQSDVDFERIAKTLADEIKTDEEEVIGELEVVKKVPEIFQSDEYRKAQGEEEIGSIPQDLASARPRLYCHFNQAEVATIGVADVVPPGTGKLKRFRY